jgi:hypothetical protein
MIILIRLCVNLEHIIVKSMEIFRV